MRVYGLNFTVKDTGETTSWIMSAHNQSELKYTLEENFQSEVIVNWVDHYKKASYGS